MNSLYHRRFYSAVLLVLFSCYTAGAELYLSLDQCRELGLKNDLSFQIQTLAVKQAVNKQRSLPSRFLPSVYLSADHQYDFGSSIDPNTNNRVAANFQFDRFALQAQLDIFNFGQLWESKIALGEVNIQLAQQQLIRQEYLTVLIEKYFAALAAQYWTATLGEQLQQTAEQVDRIQKELNDGARPESDIYDIQVVFTQEKKQLLLQQQSELNKKMELLQWINLQTVDAETLALLKPAEVAPPQQLWDAKTSLKVYAEQQKYEKLQRQQQQLLSAYLPTLSLGYAYGSFFSKQVDNIWNTSFSFGQQLNNNKSQFLGLNLRVPISSRGDARRLRMAKKIEIKQQEVQIENTVLQQHNLNQKYYRNWQQYHQLTPLLLEALSYAEKSLTTTLLKLEYGTVDISLYKIAKNQVIHARYEVINNELSANMLEILLQELQQ
ncbi:TolC family protein [Sphingobacterium sp. Mn56C]|uniref:TolC family protein n=1 Tax=Sphingobacterium sp. Mn56C TaxID=3395261 RepID=UPI003BE0B40B